MGTTNLELIEIAKKLNIKNFYCICKDELNSDQIKNVITKTPLNIIVNLNNSDNNVNGHWCLCFIDSKQKVYYSSFGDDPCLEVIKFMKEIDNRKILVSDDQIQDFNESTCGYYCLLILFFLNNGYDFKNIITSFST